MEFEPLYLTFKLALSTTIVLLVIGVPLALWLSNKPSWFKTVVETLITMPIVLPPTVIGFYLLVTLSPNSIIGEWLNDHLGIQLVFSFGGLVVASVIYSIPFMVQPIKSGLVHLPGRLKESSLMFGKSKIETLFNVIIPNSLPAILTGIVLTFAHTLGEFGVVLMIGGNIPGETKVASVAIYEEVEALNYENAHHYAITLFLISFMLLLTVNLINRHKHQKLFA